MSKLGGTFEATFDVGAAPDVAAAHFADLNAVAAATLHLIEHTLIDAHTMRVVLAEQGHAGVRYQPKYTVRYTSEPGRVRWATLEGNLDNEGEARFEATATGTRIHFKQRIGMDLPIGGLAARVLAPVVSRAIAPSARAFVEALIASIPRP